MAAKKTLARHNKKILAAAALFCMVTVALCVYHMCLLEPYWFELTETDIDLPGFHPARPLKILHLSDFHAERPVPYKMIEKAVNMGIKQHPDLVLLTGDFFTAKIKHPEKYIAILKKLSATAPTYACPGNHDGGAWAGRINGYPDTAMLRNILQKSGIILLENTSRTITINGENLAIAGLGDFWTGETKPRKALRPKGTTRNLPMLLLEHNPDAKDILQKYDWDVMFCGHTHGGQLQLPLFGAPFAPVLDHKYIAGLHLWKQRFIYITRGVGNMYGKRFNCRPEVSIIHLK